MEPKILWVRCLIPLGREDLNEFPRRFQDQ